MTHDPRIDRSDPVQAAAEDRYNATTERNTTMTTYTFTLTGTFEADTRDEALADFEDWLRMRGVAQHAAVTTDEDGEADAIWQSLSPAAKASWVAAMQPQPEAEPLTACPECDEVAVTTTAGPLPVCLACDWTGWKDES